MTKVVLGLVAAVIATITAAEVAYRLSTRATSDPVNEPWSHYEMQFRTWNGNSWTAWIRDGAFELIPQNQNDWSRHSNGSIAYVDWEGEPWQAKIDGEGFLLARHGDWEAHVDQSQAIQYRDWQGRNQLRTVAQLSR